jgi:hypothetical protein
MKAEELRIGNIINGLCGYEDGESKYEQCKVLALDSIEISEHEIWVESDGFNETYFDFNGIPLTQEWLNKFDFNTTKGTWRFRDNEYYSIESNGSLYFDDQYTATDIKYVHQLQNLYFALTGAELTIK